MALSKKTKTSTSEEAPVVVAEERTRTSSGSKSGKRRSKRESQSEAPVEEESYVQISSVRTEPVIETSTPVEEPVVETDVGETVEEDEYTTTDQILKALERETRIIRESESRRSKLLKKLRTLIRKETRKNRRSKSDKPAVKREQKKRPIIDALADLMGVSRGSEFSRGDVHSAICEYIKNNNLKSTDDKKCFELDDKLEAVLGQPKYAAHNKNESLRHSYNNLMKTLKDLFIPEEVSSE